MTKRTRVLSASLALVLLGGVLTGCSTDEAAKPGGGASSSASTSAVSPTTSNATAGSTSATASTSTSATASSTSASPTVTWSPLSADMQAKTKASLEAVGATVEFGDPSAYPKQQPAPPAPTMQAEGFTNTELGSQITVGFYIDSLYRIANGGDNETLKQVSGNNCQDCAALAKIFEDIGSEGGFPVSPRTDVYDLSLVKRSDDGALTWEGTVVYKPYTIYYPNLGAKVTSPDQGGRWLFTTRWISEGHWIIEGAGRK